MSDRQSEVTSPPLFRRYRQVARVLVRHGFVDVVDALGLGRYLSVGARLLPKALRPAPSQPKAVRLRLACEQLGPTFVKFGQALSVRSDVLPPEVTAELARLQDRVPPLAPGEADAVIEAELGRPVTALFRSFDTAPLAAASIAQVHRAVLPTGDAVVVKVRRPGIGPLIASDLAILRQLAALAERHLPGADVVDPSSLVDEFARTIRAEQDLVREGRNVERCAANFEQDPAVRIPRVHWSHTTSAVLTMEWLNGEKVSALAGRLDRETAAAVAARGADLMLAQILVHGFFHADPHPGNILVLPDGAIGLIDFGMVGRLDAATRETLARAVRAVWKRDLDRMADVALELTDPRRDVSPDALRRDLAHLLELYGDVPIGELSMADVLSDIVATLARHHLRFPSNLLLLLKAIVTIEGVGRSLDPSFRMVEHAAPLAERLWLEQHTAAATAARAADAARETVSTLRHIPAEVAAVVRKLRDNRLEVQLVHRNLDYFVREMDRASNRLSFAVVIGSIVVASALVMQVAVGPTVFGLPALGLVGFVVAGVLGLGLAVGIARSGRL